MRWCKVAKVQKVKMCLGLDGASTRRRGGGAARVRVRERESNRGGARVVSSLVGEAGSVFGAAERLKHGKSEV